MKPKILTMLILCLSFGVISSGCGGSTDKSKLKPITAHEREKGRIKALKIRSQTTWQHDYVSGKLRRYKSEYIEYDRDGNAMLEYDYDRAGQGFMKKLFWYDESGNPTKAYVYMTLGPENRLESFGTIVYKFRDDGNIAEEDAYAQTGLPLHRRKFQYDDLGNPVRIILEFLDGSEKSAGRFGEEFVFTYDSLSRRKEAIHYYINSTVRESFEYSKDGYLIRKISHYASKPVDPSDVTEYTYEFYES